MNLHGPFRCLAAGLFYLERFAVDAFCYSGVGFMGSYLDFVQGAVILGAAVMFALLNGTFDGMVNSAAIVLHGYFLLKPQYFCSENALADSLLHFPTTVA